MLEGDAIRGGAFALFLRPHLRIFMFLINTPSGNVRIQKLTAKHIFECFEKRKGEDGKINTQ